MSALWWQRSRCHSPRLTARLRLLRLQRCGCSWPPLHIQLPGYISAMCIIRYQGKLADCHRRGIDVQIGFGPTLPGAPEVARKFSTRRSARLHGYVATPPYRSDCAEQLDITITLWLRLRVCQAFSATSGNLGGRRPMTPPHNYLAVIKVVGIGGGGVNGVK